MSAFPALFIVRAGSYTAPDAAPVPDDVRDTIVDALDVLGWPAADFLRDVYRDEVDIFHETPPNPPYDAVATVVEFTQIPTDMRQYDVSDPFDHCISALYERYTNIEVWIDAVAHSAPPTNATLNM
jgi:hypothetical protein